MVYCSGAFFRQPDQLYFNLQIFNLLFYQATILTSLSSWNQIAWRLYFLNHSNVFSFELLFDLLILASFVVLTVISLIIQNASSFDVAQDRFLYLIYVIFYICLSLGFAFMYYSVYTSIKIGFSRVFPYYRTRLCMTGFFLLASLLLRVAYELVMLVLFETKQIQETATLM